MDLLKRENWWLWLIIFLFGQGVGMFILAALLKLYKKDSWYCKWYYWLIGVLFCFVPAVIMILVLNIQLTVSIAKTLKVPGSEIYELPYVWIVSMIIPIFGWIVLLVMGLYLNIFILIALYNGKAECYLEK